MKALATTHRRHRTLSVVRITQNGDRGYAMVALLVAIGLMTIMMSVAMPVWKHLAQREKEEELIFYGEQYAHAIAMFQRKFANAVAPSIDALVEQRFLRKKYKDPMTKDDFIPLTIGQAAALGQAAVAGLPDGAPRTSPQRTGQGQARPEAASTQPTSIGAAPTPSSMPGIIGVVSKSKSKSIRLYNGRNHYDEWAFVYIAPNQGRGTAIPGLAVPGQPGRSGGRGRGAPGRGGPGVRGRASNP